MIKSSLRGDCAAIGFRKSGVYVISFFSSGIVSEFKE
jgi:hypothetical protein